MAAVGPRFCSHCGQPLAEAANFCRSCGAQVGLGQTQPQAPPSAPVRVAGPPAHKSVAVAMVLAIAPALFGFLGVGHFYLERAGRGLIILLGAWLLAVIAVAVVVLSFQVSTTMGPDPLLILVAVIVYLAVFVILIWQVVDAVVLAKRWNQRVDQTGQRPW